ncbi:MAG: RIP metalloprotease RseP [Proteobacteria bacterium]|nr:RIP metalloprotease RseP [Pseudomonadota bacterium]
MSDFFSHPIIAMVLMLGGLVAFHELGHFLVGRWCGVAIETFSIGFGGTIFSKKIGQTTYQLSWIPLGGYVKFYGATRNEDTPQDLKGIPYFNASILKRCLIVAAGPAANFLLAFVIFWALILKGLELPPAQVGDVIEGSRAQQAGILPFDKFVTINGKKITSWADIERNISKNPEKDLVVEVERESKIVSLNLRPESVTGLSLFGSRAQIGRAGVALAFPSAVISVSDPNSIAALSGLSTGDRMISYKNDAGADVKVSGLHDFLKLLKTWKTKELPQVIVSVDTIELALGSDGEIKENIKGSPRELTLKPSTWPNLDGRTDRAYAEALGILDSHLTVAVVKEIGKDLLKSNDRIVSWNGKEVKTIYQLQESMTENKSETALLKVSRNGSIFEITLPLKPLEIQRAEGAVKVFVLDAAMLGMSMMPDPFILQDSNPIIAAYLALQEGSKQTAMMIGSLWAIVSGQMPLKALGGPILIAKVASESAKAGLLAFLITMALISINLALVNLFPIPVLDGGQLVMLGAEKLKGSPLTEQTTENFQKLGFVLVMCLVVLAMYNDLSRFWSSMIGSITGVSK